MTYHANLFELKRYKPLNVHIYSPRITPEPEKQSHHFKLLGKMARSLTEDFKLATISDEGRIKVLENKIPHGHERKDLELDDEKAFSVELVYETSREVGYVQSPLEYGRLVSRTVDLALAHLSKDFYKYSDVSPWIIEKGEGYFDEKLRKNIGIEDGRRYYRGLRSFEGIPCLLINREIELRSWKHLLNELKVLSNWWNRVKGQEIDFYDPSEDFVKFVNRCFRGRTAEIIAYHSRPIVIREITWAKRAKDKVLEGGLSPCEHHKVNQGITIEDEDQPLVRWNLITEDRGNLEQFHVPELLTVGHTFEDLSTRVPKSQISTVFDRVHPNCSDQQRKIYDVVSKIDLILRSQLPSLYPAKIEFSIVPKEVTKNVIDPQPIQIQFGNKEVKVEPPYGLTFYRRYSAGTTFASQVTGTIKTLVLCSRTHHKFTNELKEEFENRNPQCTMDLAFSESLELGQDFSKYNLIITITNKELEKYKRRIQNELGIPHQNVTPEHADEESIPQLAMQLCLKLGGRPWFIRGVEEGLAILSIYSYRNPFSGLTLYMFNVIDGVGRIIYQSTAYKRERALDFLRKVHEKAKEHRRLLVLTSFDDQQVYEYVLKDLANDLNEFLFILLRQNDELRLFRTYRRAVGAMPRRRRVEALSYPLESYECAPQGSITRISSDEYYVLTTVSTKVGTYYRGCPKPLRLRILGSKGSFDIPSVMRHILSLSLEAGTSGHETRLPAPLYYLKKHATYVNDYGSPENESTYAAPFYV
jgi:hypothetical protein